MESAGRSPKFPKQTVFQRVAAQRPQAPAPPVRPPEMIEADDQLPPATGGQQSPATGGEEQQAQAVNTTAYGFYRGRGGAPFLEFQCRGPEWIAASYADLRRTRWLASDGQGQGSAFVLEFRDGLKVIARGRNLRPVLEGILRQVVFRVTDMGEDCDRFLPDEPIAIYALDVAEPEEEGEGERD